MHIEAKSAPAIVTARQPYLLTNDDEIGPKIDFLFLVNNKIIKFIFDYLNTV